MAAALGLPAIAAERQERDAAAKAAVNEDERRLAKLGYKQEFKRVFNWWTNFGLSSSMVSIILGIVPLYSYSVGTGGPAVMLWSWVLIGSMTLILVSCLAEISSAYPTMGALYFWAHCLGGPRWGRFCAWTAGWANMIGQFAGVASGGYSGAIIVSNIVQLHSGVVLTNEQILGVFAGVLCVAGLVNSFPAVLVAACNFSVAWHLIGTVIIIAVLNHSAQGNRQPAVNIVTEFYDGTDFTSNAYVVLIGALAAASTFTGYDTAAHVAEETQVAQTATPAAMLGTVVNCMVLGSGLILGLNAAIPPDGVDAILYGGDYDAGDNQAVVNLWQTQCGTNLAIFFLVITLVAIECSNCANLTSAARMVYAFSRDKALPFSRFWHHVNPTVDAPVRAIWLSLTIAFLLGVPGLGNSTVLGALFSLTGTGLYTSYLIPILLRVTVARRTFIPAEFCLGWWSIPMGIFSVCWALFMIVILCLPQATPVTSSTLNYSPIMLGGVLIIAWLWWIVSARKWFKINVMAPSSVDLSEIDMTSKQDEDLASASLDVTDPDKSDVANDAKHLQGMRQV